MPRTLSSIIACWLLSAMSAQAAGDGAEIHSGPWFLRVTALSDDILRVRAAASGALPEEASWSVPDEIRNRSIHVNLIQNDESDDFMTAAMTEHFELSPSSTHRTEHKAPLTT